MRKKSMNFKENPIALIIFFNFVTTFENFNQLNLINRDRIFFAPKLNPRFGTFLLFYLHLTSATSPLKHNYHPIRSPSIKLTYEQQVQNCSKSSDNNRPAQFFSEPQKNSHSTRSKMPLKIVCIFPQKTISNNEYNTKYSMRFL